MGFILFWNEVTVRVTGWVMPLMVKFPITLTGFLPLKITEVDLKVMFGYWAESKKSLSCRTLFNRGSPVLTDFVSMVISTEPVLATGS